ALPLFVHRDARFGVRHLRLLSTGEAEHEETCPDYLDLLSHPGDETICAQRAWREIDRMTWDHVELVNLDARTALLEPDATPPDARRVSLGACPIADLSGGFEAYLQRLSANGRAQARRLIREGERAGARFEIADAGSLSGAFEDLMRLHQERWMRDGR